LRQLFFFAKPQELLTRIFLKSKRVNYFRYSTAKKKTHHTTHCVESNISVLKTKY
jgi:hypothetical protein